MFAEVFLTTDDKLLNKATALAKSLGPTGMARFIQQFDTGTGDYTKDRNKWLNQFTLDDIVSGIHTIRNSHPSIEKK